MTARTPPSLYFENTQNYHKVEERVFELSDLRAGNVRDQIVRATYLTRALVRGGLIGQDRPLLVFGGGAAGISCASVALDSGAAVWLIEIDKHPFATQLATTTRIIDPSEFDWPQPHWDTGHIPGAGLPGFALEYQRGVAASVAAAWLAIADAWEEDRDLTVICHTDARKLKWTRGEKGITLDNLPEVGVLRPSPEFGALISCIGFGNEIVYDVEQRWRYRGVKFWSSDTLSNARVGLPATAKKVQVLVSGGGDGAQQDVQRILTGKFGRDLAHKLCAPPSSAPAFPALFARMGEQCLTIDDFVWDSVDWREHKEPAPDAQEKWHNDYEAIVNEAFASMPADELRWQRQNILRKEVQREDLILTWIMKGLHPSVCYPLNRLLTLWILRLYAESVGRIPHFQRTADVKRPLDTEAIIISGYEIQKIHAYSAAHACGERSDCFGNQHMVHVSRSDRLGAPTLLGTFHEIVLRHGVKRERIFSRSAPPLMLRSTEMRQVVEQMPQAGGESAP